MIDWRNHGEAGRIPGLTAAQSRIVAELRSLGPSDAADIAKSRGLPRSAAAGIGKVMYTVHSARPDMVRRGRNAEGRVVYTAVA